MPEPFSAREPRYPIRIDIRYRRAGHRDWFHGCTENISRTGVLIRTRHSIAPHTPIEIMLALPRELGGDQQAASIGRGRVVRSEPTADIEAEAMVAAVIGEYIAAYVPSDDPRRI
jgi:hypothetical protein